MACSPEPRTLLSDYKCVLFELAVLSKPFAMIQRHGGYPPAHTAREHGKILSQLTRSLRSLQNLIARCKLCT